MNRTIDARLLDGYGQGFFVGPLVWGADGRPARIGVRLGGPGSPGEVLLSEAGLAELSGRPAELLELLTRGPFGAIPEHEAVRLMRDRAAAARIAHGRLSLRAYRAAPALGRFVDAHRPYTHQNGAVLADPFCVLCGGGTGFDRPPRVPCDRVAQVLRSLGVSVD